MKSIMKFLLKTLLILGVIAAGLWVFGPYEDVTFDTAFDESQLDGGIDAYFASQEAQVSNIRENNHKRVIWAGEAEQKTPLSIVYFHGFSASSEEIRPVPDQVAAALGANLVFTRFKGHGRDGAAMAESSVKDWMYDASEALSVARRIGEEVLIISTSTGGTIATLALSRPELRQNVVGSVFVSPNFGIQNPAAPLLTLPAARHWVPLLAGKENSFEPRNAAQEANWTTRYSSLSVFPMAASVKAANALDHYEINVPALFYYSKDDRVVVPSATERVAKGWGAPVQTIHPVLSEEDDASSHVVLGEIVSPRQTQAGVDAILKWYASIR